MKKFRGLLAIAVIIMTAIASCSKGDTGPAGPVGPAGPDSVVYSPWINLDFVENTDRGQFEDTLITPSLTQDILDKGVILTYVNFEDPDGTYHVVAVSTLIDFLREDYSVGHINIIAADEYDDLPYRYVTIPGSKIIGNGAGAKVGSYTIAELKSMPYEQVQKVLSAPRN